MGAWSLLIVLGLLVAFMGLFTHWLLILVGALLPFVPVFIEWRRRRRSRRS